MVFMLFTFIFGVIAPAASAASGDLGSEIYNKSNDNGLNKSVESVIKTVGSVGAGLFTLAVMLIAILLIFGSLSPKMTGTYWKALLLCAGGAFIFFGAYKFANVISKIAQTT